MAGRVSVSTRTQTRSLQHFVLTFEWMLSRSGGIYRNKLSSCWPCIHATGGHTKKDNVMKRKCSSRAGTVLKVERPKCFQFAQATATHVNSKQSPILTYPIPHIATQTTETVSGVNLRLKGTNTGLEQTSRSNAQIYKLSRRMNVLLPKATEQQQSVRQYSTSNHDDEEEERKRRLRGAVMYVPNPVTWLSTKWNIARLKRKLDPTFSQNEFLIGARQACCHVTQVVSSGNLELLHGLVIEEVVEWLASYRSSLSSQEWEALALHVDDIVLIKIRYVHLDIGKENALAFVDSVCFGLKVCDQVPYLVDLGIRFKQDYSTTPPSGWVVAGVTHIRLQKLASE